MRVYHGCLQRGQSGTIVATVDLVKHHVEEIMREYNCLEWRPGEVTLYSSTSKDRLEAVNGSGV